MNKILKWVLIVFAILILLVVGTLAYEIFFSPSMEVKKPAVYLYPEEDSQVSVALDINGKLTEDIPSYNNGWNVFVTKEGLIENQYDYLFYEAELNYYEIPEEGWIVPFNELASWFESNLEAMGLNEKESFQFQEYWLNRLPEANFYEVKLMSENFLNENMDLIISPKPDTEIRLDFYFKALDESYEINNPEILTPSRNGFTVVEWGGVLIE
jgi:hypothetical protein